MTSRLETGNSWTFFYGVCTCFTWAFVPRAFYVCTSVHVAAYCRSVGSASALACCYCEYCNALVSPSHGARHSMEEVFLQIEWQWWRKSKSLGESDVRQNKWNQVCMAVNVQREKNPKKSDVLLANFEKHRKIKPGLYEKCLILFSCILTKFRFCKNRPNIYFFAKITRFFPFSRKELKNFQKQLFFSNCLAHLLLSYTYKRENFRENNTFRGNFETKIVSRKSTNKWPRLTSCPAWLETRDGGRDMYREPVMETSCRGRAITIACPGRDCSAAMSWPLQLTVLHVYKHTVSTHWTLASRPGPILHPPLSFHCRRRLPERVCDSSGAVYQRSKSQSPRLLQLVTGVDLSQILDFLVPSKDFYEMFLIAKQKSRTMGKKTTG